MIAPRMVLHVMNGAAGGAALSTMGLINALAARGVRSCAACLDSGTDEERAALSAACEGRVLFLPLYLWNKKVRSKGWKRPLIEARQLIRTGAAIASSRRVTAFAAAHGAELVHSNTILTTEGARVARQLRVPHVWHVRELVGAGAPFRLPLEEARLGEFLATHADMVIANSRVTAARLSPWLSDQLLRVVPNGLDLTRFAPVERQGRRPVVVAMVANLTSRWKNHGLFVEAVARAGPEVDASFRIYGHAPAQDPWVQEIKEQIRSRCDGRVTLEGFQADVAALMADIDILVHPAADESFGRIIIEAWASGAAVVGVDAGGVGELVRDDETGLLVPPGDADALAARICSLVVDVERRALLADAGLREARRFSIEGHTEQVLRIYQEAAERCAGTGAAA